MGLMTEPTNKNSLSRGELERIDVGTNGLFFGGSDKLQSNQADPIIKCFTDVIEPQMPTKRPGYTVKNYLIKGNLEYETLATLLVEDKTGNATCAVTYFTGKKRNSTVTVEEYMNKVQDYVAESRNFNGRLSFDVLLQDNFNNDAVVSYIRDRILAIGANDNVKNVDFAVFFSLSTPDSIDPEKAEAIATNIIDSILYCTFVENDLSIDESMYDKKLKWSVYYGIHNNEKSFCHEDVFGHLVAKKISIRTEGTQERQIQSLGLADTESHIFNSEIYGVLDFSFDTVTEPIRVAPGQEQINTYTVAVPNFIVTGFNSKQMSLTSFFLSLANTAQVVQDRGHLNAYMLNSFGNYDSVANLNLLVNVEGRGTPNQDDMGTVHADTKKWSEDMRKAFLDKAIYNGCTISINIDQMSAGGYLNQILAMAGGVNTTHDVREAFTSLIHNVVERLTGGVYSYRGAIFATEPMKYPIGRFGNSSGVHTLDSITMPEIIGMIKNNEEALNVAVSLNSAIDTPNDCIRIGNESFDSMICHINSLMQAGVRNGIVQGIGYRLTFNHDFIDALVTAVNSANFRPNVIGSRVDDRTFERRIKTGMIGSIPRGSRFNQASRGYKNIVTGGYSNFR